MATVKRVLVATDGSDEAAQAIEWLAAFPLPADVAVEVVTVDHLYAESKRVVDDAQRLLATRWPDVAARVLDGDPRRAILDAATKAQADLIVLGARGLGAGESFLLGSVSLGVTRYARCAVSSAAALHGASGA